MDQGTQTVGRNAGKRLRLSNCRQRESLGLCGDKKQPAYSALLAQGELFSGLAAVDSRYELELGQVT